jgi:LmbE family N-acetylglucosaminyl deacetylase
MRTLDRSLRERPALDWLGLKVAIVVAHPDDETIGLGAQFAQLRDPLLVQVTDGAPRSFGAGREDYARARRDEVTAALRAGGAHSVDRREIGVVDQEASLDLARITARLIELLAERRPEVILTHPYEGGHPDHDATAFAVHAAVRSIKWEKIPAPVILEFTSYHAGPGGAMITGEFLPAEGCPENSIALGAEARRRKRAMIESFVTQREVLQAFPLDHERFRPAPAYDFTAPPHPGELYYERFDWGMTGARWRKLAHEALFSKERFTL